MAENLYIYCEGQTEEQFISKVLYPFLLPHNIVARPIICTTSTKHGQIFKGGVSRYQKIKNEITNLCKEHKNEHITTMFDFYHLPKDTPGLTDSPSSLYEKVSHIEKSIENDIAMTNLFFNLTIHEFEGLLFSDINAFNSITDTQTINKLQAIRNDFESPEHINDSPETIPSKRLKNNIPSYNKVLHGILISNKINIDKICKECKHFSKWIDRILSITRF